jgi:hypothetical protein
MAIGTLKSRIEEKRRREKEKEPKGSLSLDGYIAP